MAVIAVAAVGAGVGSVFGSAALGWAIGSVIGQSLFAETQRIEGPRLGDLSVQTSSYGAHIPKLYGTMRTAGNIIDSTDIQETKHTERSGGKGGGGGTSQTTYTYSVSCAVAICEGTILGVRKIWADGKLIYNTGSNTAGSLYASSVRSRRIRVYPGDNTQEPDPFFETLHGGVGQYPAYRGTAYITIEDLELKDFGNRIPNFTFEVVNAGTTTGIQVTQTVKSIGTAPCGGFGGSVFGGFGAGYGAELIDGVISFNWGSGSIHHGGNYGRVELDINGNIIGRGLPTVLWQRGSVGGVSSVQGRDWWMAGRVGGKWLFVQTPFGVYSQAQLFASKTNTSLILGGALYGGIRITENPLATGNLYADTTAGNSLKDTFEFLYSVCVSPNGDFFFTFFVNLVDGVYEGTYMRKYDSSLDVVDTWEISGVPDRIGTGYNIAKKAWAANWQPNYPGSSRSPIAVESDGVTFWFKSVDDIIIYELDETHTGDEALTAIDELKDSGLDLVGTSKWMLADHGQMFVWSHNRSGQCSNANGGSASTQAEAMADQVNISFASANRLGSIDTDDPATLEGILLDIMTTDPRLTIADLDLTAAAGVSVAGYSRSGVMSMRSAIQALQQAYFFDIIESDHKLKVVMRGGER